MMRSTPAAPAGYDVPLWDVVRVIEEARRAAARSVNAVMTATYWLVGRRIVEEEQAGSARAAYGEALLERLAADLTERFRRGFSRQNLQQMQLFYLAYPPERIRQTLSGESQVLVTALPIRQTPSSESSVASPATADLTGAFPMSWSHYVRLLGVRNEHARAFYETEALRGGWTVRQLDRQIGSQFYERTALSRNKAAMLTKGAVARPEDAVSPEEEIKAPYVLEFLGLKDDVVFLTGRRLAASDLLALQPIDTWVDQVRMLIDPSAPAGYDAAANWFVAHADAGYDPARLNAGAWYLGKHAFRVSLALLSSTDISKEEFLRLPLWGDR